MHRIETWLPLVTWLLGELGGWMLGYGFGLRRGMAIANEGWKRLNPIRR